VHRVTITIKNYKTLIQFNGCGIYGAFRKEKIPDDTWICDSGACGNYCHFVEGLYDAWDTNEDITYCSGNIMIAIVVGSIKCKVGQVDGSALYITLNEVQSIG
jgi:hypothetical protein